MKGSLLEINTERRQVIIKAREGKLMPDDLADGTFTITSTGAFSKFWHVQTPIIN